MKISAHLHAILTAAGLDVAATIKGLVSSAEDLEYGISTNIADKVNGRIPGTTFSNIGIMINPTEAGLYSLTAATPNGAIDLLRVGNNDFIALRPKLGSDFANSLARQTPRFLRNNQTLSDMLNTAGGKPQWLAEVEGTVEISGREIEIHAASGEIEITIDFGELAEA